MHSISTISKLRIIFVKQVYDGMCIAIEQASPRLGND